MTMTVLGRKVGLSPNAAGARFARLVDSGVISGVHARVNPAALGREIEAIVDCRLRSPDEREPLGRIVAADDRIEEAIHITGRVDFRLRVFVSSPNDLDQMLTVLRNEGGVAETDTTIVLSRLSVAGNQPPLADD